MALDEYSLLHGLGLELPVQIDNSVGQDFLLLEKKITLQQLMLFMSMKNLSRTRVKKKKASGPRL